MRTIAFAVLLLLGSICRAQTPQCGAGEYLVNHAQAQSESVSTASGGMAPNGVSVFGFFNGYTCTSIGISWIVNTIDSSTSNYYQIGLVETSGTLLGSTAVMNGPAFSPTAGKANQAAWSQGTITIPYGPVFLFVATNCASSCAALWSDVNFGLFYWAIAADTASNSPWNFSTSSGVCGGGGTGCFSGSNLPIQTLTLSSTATQTISGTTATVTVTQSQVAHVQVGALITVKGVTTSGATNLNCTNCAVTAVNDSSSTISYSVPSTTFSGTINSGATLFVPPTLPNLAGFNPPTVMYY